jgi:hypothetical protein
MVDISCVFLSSGEKGEQVLSGTHAASGRHVSTWVHAVYSCESQLVGGSLPILALLPILVSGPVSSFLTTLTILWKSLTLPNSSRDSFSHLYLA